MEKVNKINSGGEWKRFQGIRNKQKYEKCDRKNELVQRKVKVEVISRDRQV